MSETCGCWVEVGSYETFCAEPPDHEGPCRPRLVELLNRLSTLATEQKALSAYVLDTLLAKERSA